MLCFTFSVESSGSKSQPTLSDDNIIIIASIGGGGLGLLIVIIAAFVAVRKLNNKARRIGIEVLPFLKKFY